MESAMQPDGDRVILVTGGGKGLGAAFATAWARRGGRVVINNRHAGVGQSSAATMASALCAEGHDAIGDEHAVDETGAAAAIIDTAIRNYGRLDALILNVGISGPSAPATEIGEADLHEVMRVNFYANAALVRAAMPYLTASPNGRILFVSSNGGLHGVSGRAAYAASKGALTSYALTLADELRSSAIGVNMLMPFASTSMTSARAAPDPPMHPELVAPAAVWLTSAMCTVTGEIWIAGGGGVRRAQAMESVGAWHPELTPEWFSENHAALSDMADARSYSGAMASFIAFCASCREQREARRLPTDA